MTKTQPDLDSSLSARFGVPAEDARVRRTAAALEANGITALRASNGAEAERIVLDLIPAGAQVHHGASQTLEARASAQRSTGPVGTSRSAAVLEHGPGDAGRRDPPARAAAPDVMLGSVHAVTETGSLLSASMGGSQLGPYVSGAGRVILVVGRQKIVADLEEGLRRINEYALPLEDARAKAAYGIHSAVNKVLIINREVFPGGSRSSWSTRPWASSDSRRATLAGCGRWLSVVA